MISLQALNRGFERNTYKVFSLNTDMISYIRKIKLLDTEQRRKVLLRRATMKSNMDDHVWREKGTVECNGNTGHGRPVEC